MTVKEHEEIMFSVLYPIEKALFLLNGGNCSRERVRNILKCITFAQKSFLSNLAGYMNNAFFKDVDLFSWILYRYVVYGKCDFPDKSEVNTREICRSTKEFYKNKLTADIDFLNSLCQKIGKPLEYLTTLNKYSRTHLYELYLSGKIGMITIMEIGIPNHNNQEEYDFYKRTQKVKQIIKR
jgi:hypothetical protein